MAIRTKPKKWVGRHQADERAIKFYLAIRELEQMPAIGVQIREEKNAVLIWDKSDNRIFCYWSVSDLLSRDLAKVKRDGGTYEALMNARKPPPRPGLPQAEIDRAVQAFMTGDEEESAPE